MDKHIAFLAEHAPKVKDALKPLNKKWLIDFFAYGRFYDDGAYALLTTTPSLYAYFHQQNMKLTSPSPKSIIGEQFFYLLPPDGYYKDAYAITNVWQPLDIIYRHKGYYDFFCFATTQKKQQMANVYLNQLPVLEKFNDYFYENYQPLINNAIKNKQWLTPERRTNFGGLSAKKEPGLLTTREKQCLHWLLKSLSNKKIADKLKLSIRTVDMYVDSVKNKLGCNTRHEIMDKIFAEQWLDYL